MLAGEAAEEVGREAGAVRVGLVEHRADVVAELDRVRAQHAVAVVGAEHACDLGRVVMLRVGMVGKADREGLERDAELLRHERGDG